MHLALTLPLENREYMWAHRDPKCLATGKREKQFAKGVLYPTLPERKNKLAEWSSTERIPYNEKEGWGKRGVMSLSGEWLWGQEMQLFFQQKCCYETSSFS